jgi:hypothetical protein
MYVSKKAQGFAKWLINAKREGLFPKGCLNLKTIDKTKTEIFIANTTEGQPLCVFEVGQEVDVFNEHKNFLLKKLPAYCLKFPGYSVLFSKIQKSENKPIINFRVKKFMPRERFVGDFSPRDFAKFMAATINTCRKQQQGNPYDQ